MSHSNNIERKAFIPHNKHFVDVSIYNFEPFFWHGSCTHSICVPVTSFYRKAFIRMKNEDKLCSIETKKKFNSQLMLQIMTGLKLIWYKLCLCLLFAHMNWRIGQALNRASTVTKIGKWNMKMKKQWFATHAHRSMRDHCFKMKLCIIPPVEKKFDLNWSVKMCSQYHKRKRKLHLRRRIWVEFQQISNNEMTTIQRNRRTLFFFKKKPTLT